MIDPAVVAENDRLWGEGRWTFCEKCDVVHLRGMHDRPPPRKPTNDRSVVYAIKAGAHIKIGTTRNLESRLKTLQTGQAEPLMLVGSCPGDVKLERALHRQFSQFRVSGEWFALTAQAELQLLERLGGGTYTIHLPRAGKKQMTKRRRYHGKRWH